MQAKTFALRRVVRRFALMVVPVAIALLLVINAISPPRPDPSVASAATSMLAGVLPKTFQTFSIDDSDLGVVDGCHAILASDGSAVNANVVIPARFEHGGLLFGLTLKAANGGSGWEVSETNVDPTRMSVSELHARVLGCVSALMAAAGARPVAIASWPLDVQDSHVFVRGLGRDASREGGRSAR